MRSVRYPIQSVVVFLSLSVHWASAAERVLTLATTTSTEDSGLLSHIHPDFERRFGIKMKVVAKGTGASLQLARDGNADVVLAHAREQEDEFVAQGFGLGRRDVMYNDFVVIGPSEDPAGIRGSRDAGGALRKIHNARALFVSRGDNSGTHLAEQLLWRQSGVPLADKQQQIVKDGQKLTTRVTAPAGDWYRSIGRGMGEVIQYATEKRGYALTDRGTYYAYALDAKPRTDLVILCEGDARLRNNYGVIAVNPKKHPHVNYDWAMKYIDWITSPETQRMIGEYKKGGKVLFHPSLGADKAPDAERGG